MRDRHDTKYSKFRITMILATWFPTTSSLLQKVALIFVLWILITITTFYCITHFKTYRALIGYIWFSWMSSTKHKAVDILWFFASHLKQHIWQIRARYVLKWPIIKWLMVYVFGLFQSVFNFVLDWELCVSLSKANF